MWDQLPRTVLLFDGLRLEAGTVRMVKQTASRVMHEPMPVMQAGVQVRGGRWVGLGLLGLAEILSERGLAVDVESP